MVGSPGVAPGNTLTVMGCLPGGHCPLLVYFGTMHHTGLLCSVILPALLLRFKVAQTHSLFSGVPPASLETLPLPVTAISGHVASCQFSPAFPYLPCGLLSLDF